MEENPIDTVPDSEGVKDDSDTQGDTIMLQLDDAAHLVLQQQGLYTTIFI